MRASTTKDGLTLRAIAGTHNVLLGIDLDPAKRAGCLGFSIFRTDLGPAAGGPPAGGVADPKPFPSSLRFLSDQDKSPTTSDLAPIQKFRWGDYTAHPGERYRYKVTARYGKPGALTDGDSVEVEVTTEDPAANRAAAVFFNRGAAASQAYNAKFGQDDPDKLPPDQRAKALAWLSRGLEEALLAFLAQATDGSFALHAAIYEFQKPELLAGLKQALDRGAQVQVAYHHRKANAKDDTWKKNEEAIQAAGFPEGICHPRAANPQNAIMHNKFVVLLKKDGETFVPQAVWTGSTNWTEGAIYGQLNVGHAVYDPQVAATYEAYFQLLHKDAGPDEMKKTLATVSPVPKTPPAGPCTLPILSPQADETMLDLYAAICSGARCLLVCAPFELAPQIDKTFVGNSQGTLHFLLADKESSFGKPNEIQVVEGNQENQVAFAATLASSLTDFQEGMLKKTTAEHYHHAGIHIHSKIILADPFGDDPILVTGSANYSNNSTIHNDSNSLLVRGNTAVADIYATEFLRMFEHYRFRAEKAKAEAAKETEPPLGLKEDDSWSAPYYVDGSNEELGRKLFAGTA
jgi:phosphatidylserine/phosphatidylglycerophosphate/cardiolipin synthase-like enzyme